MKTFVDWMLKTLTGALAIGIFLLAAGSHAFPLTLPLLMASGKRIVLSMPDAIGFVVFVLLGATILYLLGYLIGKAMRVLWSKF